jgi:hypothetical protein
VKVKRTQSQNLGIFCLYDQRLGTSRGPYQELLRRQKEGVANKKKRKTHKKERKKDTIDPVRLDTSRRRKVKL